MRGLFRQRTPAWLLGRLLVILGLGLALYAAAAGREYLLGQQAEAAGQPAQAAQHYQAVAVYLPWQPDLWLQSARLLLQAGDAGGALRILGKPDLAGALSAQDLLTQGDAYLSLHDGGSAETAWRRALEKGAGGDVVYTRLAALHQQAQNYPAEAEDRKALAALNPRDGPNLLRLGQMLSALQPEACLAYLEQAAAADPQLAAQAGRLQQAVQTGLLAVEPGYALLQAGRALAAQGSWELARLALQNAAQTSPSLAEAWAYLAEVEQQSSPPDLEQARQHLAKAAALAPQSLAVNGLWALFWQRQGRYDQALIYLEKAAASEPRNPLWQVTIGQAHAALGDLPAAEGAFLAAVALAPGQAEYQRALAEFDIQFQIKINDQALPAAREAVRLQPDDPANQDVLGQALFLAGDAQAALQAYQLALKLDAKYAPANLHLAVLYTAAGKPDLAYQALQQARQTSSDPAIADQAARLLEYFFP